MNHPDSSPSAPSGPNRRRRLALWGTIGAIVLIAGALVASRDPSGREPTPLPLALGAGGGAETATASDAMFAAAVSYVAADRLPLLGGTGPAYRLDPPSDDRITALASALGVDGSVDSADGSRRVVGNGFELSVFGTSWSFFSTVATESGNGGVVSTGVGVACPAGVPGEKPIPCEPDVPACTLPDGAEPAVDGSGCAVGDRPFEPERPADLPTQDEARQVALAALDAAGFDTRGAVVEVYDSTTAWSVDVRFAVDGHPVAGLHAYLTVGGARTIVDAGGTIGELIPLGDYPLVDTRAAIDRLNENGGFGGGVTGGPTPLGGPDVAVASDGGSGGPGSEPSIDQPARPVEEPFVEPEPVVVTLDEAEVGGVLVGSWDGGETYMVPAYVFAGADADGNAFTDVTVVAVDDDLLSAPEAGPDPDVPVDPPPSPIPGPTPAPVPGPGPEVSGYADILLHCGDIVDFDGRWWHTDADVSNWNDRTEGGTLSVDPADPDLATFVGDAEGTKTATFRAGGPTEAYPGCE